MLRAEIEAMRLLPRVVAYNVLEYNGLHAMQHVRGDDARSSYEEVFGEIQSLRGAGGEFEHVAEEDITSVDFAVDGGVRCGEEQAGQLYRCVRPTRWCEECGRNALEKGTATDLRGRVNEADA
jgi:hypothetical protein